MSNAAPEKCLLKEQIVNEILHNKHGSFADISEFRVYEIILFLCNFIFSNLFVIR
jgi:hypothetical protein